MGINSLDTSPVTRVPLRNDHSGENHGCVAEGNELPSTSLSSYMSPHMPCEWSLVRRDLRVMLKGQCHDSATHSQNFAKGCESFESCVALSRQYALKIDIDTIETVGIAQLALGKGLNSAMMSEHMSLVRRVGLRAALHEMSQSLLPCTLQPRASFLVTPPPRRTPLPISPHPALVPIISPSAMEEIKEHQLLAGQPLRGCNPEPIEVTETTRATLMPFHERLTMDEKLHMLAHHGGQFLVADDFRPNGGVGVVAYPRSVAPMAAIEAHMAANQRKGRMVILPLEFAQDECARQGLDLHVSNVSIASTPGAEPAIGRLISDYSHPEGASMMFAGKKEINKLFFTPIKNPTAADVCQLHANAVAAFPGEEIVAARLDISSAYNRVRLHPPCIPLGALYFTVADGSIRRDAFGGMVWLAGLQLSLAFSAGGLCGAVGTPMYGVLRLCVGGDVH